MSDLGNKDPEVPDAELAIAERTIDRLREEVRLLTESRNNVVKRAGAERDRLRAEVAALKESHVKYDKAAFDIARAEASGWASSCTKLRRQCEDMAMMIKRLVYANEATGKKAMAMVERFDLLGSPLRKFEDE